MVVQSLLGHRRARKGGSHTRRMDLFSGFKCRTCRYGQILGRLTDKTPSARFHLLLCVQRSSSEMDFTHECRILRSPISILRTWAKEYDQKLWSKASGGWKWQGSNRGRFASCGRRVLYTVAVIF